MKILVDEMPKKAEDCPWSYPIENPWNDYTTWFCQYSLSNGETCPMVKGGECPFFITVTQQSDLDCIIDAFNTVPEVHPVPLADIKKGVNL